MNLIRMKHNKHNFEVAEDNKEDDKKAVAEDAKKDDKKEIAEYDKKAVESKKDKNVSSDEVKSPEW